MGAAERATSGAEPPDWMVLEEMFECREFGCLMMLRDLAIGKIDPVECFPRYFTRIEEAFTDREAELEVPFISRGRETVQRLGAVRAARRRYMERAGEHLKKLLSAGGT